MGSWGDATLGCRAGGRWGDATLGCRTLGSKGYATLGCRAAGTPGDATLGCRMVGTKVVPHWGAEQWGAGVMPPWGAGWWEPRRCHYGVQDIEQQRDATLGCGTGGSGHDTTQGTGQRGAEVMPPKRQDSEDHGTPTGGEGQRGGPHAAVTRGAGRR